MDQSQNHEKFEAPAPCRRFAPILAEIWIGATIAAFVVIRILGSNIFRHLLHRFVDR